MNSRLGLGVVIAALAALGVTWFVLTKGEDAAAPDEPQAPVAGEAEADGDGASEEPGTWERESTPDVVAGAWKGELDLGQAQLPLVFNLHVTEEGVLAATVDSPQQGSFGIPVKDAPFEDGRIILDLPIIDARFQGALSRDGTELDGTWTQRGHSWPLVMTRAEAGDVAEAPERPQEPKAPFPYVVREVTFESAEKGITLAGTLTLPEGEGPFPGVVLISGSGPQDRDESLLGHKPFLVWADYLTRKGVAVLRFDDRGFGASGGDFASAVTDDFAEDARGAFAFLRQADDIDPDKVGFLGHNEGGLVAAMVAADHPEHVAFVAMIAPIAVPLRKLMAAQVEALSRAAGQSESSIKDVLRVQSGVFDALEAADTPEGAVDDLTVLFMQNGATEEAARQQAMIYATPWWHRLLRINPRDYLSRLKAPTLALYGSKDLQVVPNLNAPSAEAALLQSGAFYSVRVLDGLNHLLQTAKTGHVSEYSQIEETISPIALEALSGWILRQLAAMDEG